MVKSLDERIEKLLSKTECMVLLCSKASSYWSMVKFAFNIPLVIRKTHVIIKMFSKHLSGVIRHLFGVIRHPRDI